MSPHNLLLIVSFLLAVLAAAWTPPRGNAFALAFALFVLAQLV